MIGAEQIQQQFAGVTDEVVVGRIRDGEDALFEVIMRRYNTRIFRVARGILKDDEEAEDVMQEAYVRAFTNLHQFEGRSRFATWLTKIAVYEALARGRKQGRLADFDDAEDPDSDGAKDVMHVPRSPEDNTSLRELNVVLEGAIGRLPAKLRAVVMLRDVEEMSTAETAELLGLSQEAVKVRLHRARTALRETIDARISEATRQTYLFLVPRCNAMVGRVFVALNLAI